jgi:glycosyl-4,4'-diaponeurosporenoate acyltransferase
MKLYLIIISVCSLIIAAIVSICYQAGFFITLAWVALAVVMQILIDAMVAAFARLLPKKCANFRWKIYRVSANEKRGYERLKIRSWKDKIPEIGHFTGFRKNKLVAPKSVEYVERFLMESCYGELGHLLALPFGFLALILYPISTTWLALAIPVACVNAILNLLPIFVLRYNSYKLTILLESNVKKREKERAIA